MITQPDRPEEHFDCRAQGLVRALAARLRGDAVRACQTVHHPTPARPTEIPPVLQRQAFTDFRWQQRQADIRGIDVAQHGPPLIEREHLIEDLVYIEANRGTRQENLETWEERRMRRFALVRERRL